MIHITTWVVEDDSNYRRTLKRLLSEDDHITCGAVFPSCIELFSAIEKEPRPDLILMDLGLPGMGGVQGIQRLSEVAPEVTVIVLTVFDEKEKVLKAVESGAAGYLLKTATSEEIIQGLRQVYMGGTALSPKIAQIVLGELRKQGAPDDFGLTTREIEVLEELAQGLSVKEIGSTLGVSRRTI
ncbi:MAG: response regulator transcription factor, partial [Verrucomicrobiota bacterium]